MNTPKHLTPQIDTPYGPLSPWVIADDFDSRQVICVAEAVDERTSRYRWTNSGVEMIVRSMDVDERYLEPTDVVEGLYAVGVWIAGPVRTPIVWGITWPDGAEVPDPEISCGQCHYCREWSTGEMTVAIGTLDTDGLQWEAKPSGYVPAEWKDLLADWVLQHRMYSLLPRNGQVLMLFPADSEVRLHYAVAWGTGDSIGMCTDDIDTDILHDYA